jgi:hypothetical protein
MALSIGAITTMFSVIEAVLLRPLPHDPTRLVMLWSAVPSKDIQRNWTSYPDIQDWKRESRSFSEIAAMLRVDTADLTGAVPVEHTKVGRVIFRILFRARCHASTRQRLDSRRVGSACAGGRNQPRILADAFRRRTQCDWRIRGNQSQTSCCHRRNAAWF